MNRLPQLPEEDHEDSDRRAPSRKAVIGSTIVVLVLVVLVVLHLTGVIEMTGH